MRNKTQTKGDTMKTTEEIRDILETKVNWTEVHHARVGEHGQRVELWLEDDETVRVVVMEQNSFQPGVEILGCLPCWGRGAMDIDTYAADWTRENGDGTYTVIETGEVLDESDMIHRCIDEGDWDYPDWIEEIVVEAEHANHARR